MWCVACTHACKLGCANDDDHRQCNSVAVPPRQHRAPEFGGSGIKGRASGAGSPVPCGTCTAERTTHMLALSLGLGNGRCVLMDRERDNRFAIRPLRVDFHGPTQWLARCPRDGRIPNCVTSLPQAPRPDVAFAFPTEVNYSPWPLSPDRFAGARTILGKTPNYREIAHNGNREATHMYRNAGSSNRSGFENGLIYVHRVYLCAFRR